MSLGDLEVKISFERLGYDLAMEISLRDQEKQEIRNSTLMNT